MGTDIFYVHKSGVLTTFQDLGRTGYQRFGVPVSGAMDPFSIQVANILVGNHRDESCLEVTLVGPELEARQTITLAITGADLQPSINGRPLAMWKSFTMREGDRLTFGKLQSGVRAYIAVAGGFHTPSVFGSQSTDLNSGFGHILKKGDRVKGASVQGASGIGFMRDLIPVYKQKIEVAVVEGPHIDLFTKNDVRQFFQTTFSVGANSNRMGYRLNAKTFQPLPLADIWSDATPLGSIQIPANGEPIILMADRQTTGGYPRIGTVVSSDIPSVAQLLPRGEICFYSITVEVAQQRLKEMKKFLDRLETFRVGLG